MTSSSVTERVVRSVKGGVPKAGKTILWLLKLILPISLGVRLLQYYGVLEIVAGLLNPLFQMVGLPGEASIAFVCSVFLPLYAPIAVAGTLSLSIRQLTILGIMCLISHNTFVESAVQKKTGSSFAFVWFLRIGMSFLAAFLWNLLLPENMGVSASSTLAVAGQLTLWAVLKSWAIGALGLSLKIALIVTGLMILQRLLEEFRVMDFLSRVFAPVMRFMGLAPEASFLWFVANIIGLTYGSAVLIEQIQDGKLGKPEARMLNNHLAISHSLLEDTALFAVLGVPVFWVTVPRVGLAIMAVWIIRLFRKINPSRKLKLFSKD